VSDLADLTLGGAAARLRAITVSPLELTRAYLERIERHDPALNAFITVTAERALDDARRATEEISSGRWRGPLHGVPIAIKDLVATRGIRTTAGAKIFADHVPEEDATIVRRLSDAGAVLLGKLNTHELAYGVTTNNPHFGAAKNPWKLDAIPGGSSGGSGAATAAHLAVATIGTDTGGSIRIPASLCGVVGLKPSYGRASKAGVVPLSFLFDHVGPLARSVTDAALMLEAIAGYDPADATTVRAEPERWSETVDRSIRGLRVGVPRRWFFDRLDREVRQAIETALAVFADLGAIVSDVDVAGAAEAVSALFAIVLAEAKEIYGRAFAERPGDFGPDLRQILSQPTPDAIEIMAGLRTVRAFAAAARETLERVDVLVTPTTPVAAPAQGTETVDLDGQAEATIFALIRCTAPFNASHLPALSVPCGLTRAPLPIGLQIAGRPLDEATVLRAGHAYEQATDWHRRHPPDFG